MLIRPFFPCFINQKFLLWFQCYCDIDWRSVKMIYSKVSVRGCVFPLGRPFIDPAVRISLRWSVGENEINSLNHYSSELDQHCERSLY